jgi:hypothetical protein
MRRVHGCIVVVAVVLGCAGPAAARPADVRIINTPQDAVPVEAAQPLPIKGPDFYRAAGSLTTNSPPGTCSTSLFSSLPAGHDFVLTNVEVDATDTVRPEFVVWLRQQTGGGFFTHFVGVPLTSFAVNGILSGTLTLYELIEPGSSGAGQYSDVFVCLAPGAGDSGTTGRYSLTGYLVDTDAAAASATHSALSSKPAATG